MEKFSNEKEKILEIVLPSGVRKVALFGLFVRGETSPESDSDIRVELKPMGQRPPIGYKWFELEEELSRILGRKGDLISEKGA